MNDPFFTSILSDSDDSNVSIAMLEILKNGNVKEVIRQNQDSDNPIIRKRIQQLASVVARKEAYDTLRNKVDDDDFTMWDLIKNINVLMDARASLQQLDSMLFNLLGKCPPPIHNMEEFRSLISELQLNYEPMDDNFVVQLLPFDVMVHLTGALSTVTIIAQQLGKLCGFETEMVQINGQYCLHDEDNVFIYPADKWKMLKAKTTKRFTKPSKRQVAIDMLARILASAYVDQLTTTFVDANSLLLEMMKSQVRMRS